VAYQLELPESLSGVHDVTTGNSNTSVCVKTHGKRRIHTEKYFSDGVPSENNTQKYNDKKITFFCEFAIRNSFSVGT